MDFFLKSINLMILTLLISVNFVNSLECYVCEEQEDNDGKCASTVTTCDYGQDRCLSIIKWGSTPYWEMGAPMQYYISKMCADQQECEKKHNETILSGLCERIEWRDWYCSECCQGDRCNYYITLAGSTVSSSIPLLLSALLSWMFLF